MNKASIEWKNLRRNWYYYKMRACILDICVIIQIRKLLLIWHPHLNKLERIWCFITFTFYFILNVLFIFINNLEFLVFSLSVRLMTSNYFSKYVIVKHYGPLMISQYSKWNHISRTPWIQNNAYAYKSPNLGTHAINNFELIDKPIPRMRSFPNMVYKSYWAYCQYASLSIKLRKANPEISSDNFNQLTYCSRHRKSSKFLGIGVLILV